MTLCDGLSDRMPLVAAGRVHWTDEESVHLSSCADCAAGWQLIAVARRLGAAVPAGDPVGIAARVRERLAADASAPAKVIPLRPRRATGWVWGLALAAAVVLAVALPRWRSTMVPSRSEPGAGSAQSLSELDDLSASELEAVLKEFDTGPGIGESAPAGTGDLNTDELERILRSMEG